MILYRRCTIAKVKYSVSFSYRRHARNCHSFNNCYLSDIANFSITERGSAEVIKQAQVLDEPISASRLQDLIQICARNKFISKGKSCHAMVLHFGFFVDTLINNILINMYCKFGDIGSARDVFASIPQRSVVSWNTIIAGYTHIEKTVEALELFADMHREGQSMTEFTLSSAICACAVELALSESKQLHALAIKNSMDTNVYVGTAILDVYAKSCKIHDGYLVFDSMTEKSSVTWSSMIAGFVQNDLPEEALSLCHLAQKVGVERTQFTLSAALSASATLAAKAEGTQFHAVVIRSGFDSNLHIGSSLVDLYSRCGCIESAYAIFASMSEKNIIMWNAMISGFSRHARIHEVMILFEKLQLIGVCPNEVTYVSVLSACSHMGLVEKGRYYFDLMRRDKNVEPSVFHYSCMVDILGRAGLISEAYDLIIKMPFNPTAMIWGSLLNSCRIHGDTNLARVAAVNLFEIEPHNAANHVLLSNIYAADKKWGEVAMTRKLLRESGARKEAGKSWIQVKHKVHIFTAGEDNHSQIAEIYHKLDDIGKRIRDISYHTKIQFDLHDVDEECKELLLKHHSEKLAFALGLISLPANTPIMIFKNLRICGDCHSFFKFASIVSDREIIVRDTNRFHHFKDSFCSCSEFW